MSNFRFDFDVEVFQKAGSDGTRDRRIGGIVSTNDMDRQSETLVQEGLDFSNFTRSGYFNDNHDRATEALVGYPEKVELRDLGKGRKGWYVEGYLLKGSQRADRIWEIAKALQKSDRRLGFSVEGNIVERDSKDPRTVRKAVVREVAITRCPVNTQTGLDVLAKSLAAGQAVQDPGTTSGEGFALRQESLEGGAAAKKKKKKKLKKSEAIALLQQLNPNVTPDVAQRIVEYAIRWHPATK